MTARWAVVLACVVAGCGRPVGAPVASPPSVAAAPNPIALAQQALNEKQFARAAELLAPVVRDHPEDRRALALYGRITQQQAGMAPEGALRFQRFRESARVMRMLRDAHAPLRADEIPLLAASLYNDACALAQENQPDAALTALGEAVDAGFGDVTLLGQDDDLAPIRDRPEFRKLLSDAGLRGMARLLARAKSFPFALQATDRQGRPVDLGALRGKVVLVNFWAPWSPPCARQIPWLTEIRKKYDDRGVEVVGLSNAADAPAVAAFLKDKTVPYPLILDDAAARRQLPRWDGYPTTLLIDRQGRVRLALEGFGLEDRSATEEAIRILCDETPASGGALGGEVDLKVYR